MYQIHSITQEVEEFPARLHHIPPVPKNLYWAGDLTLANKPSIAIVGSRAMTRYGRDVCTWFARELGRCGYVIISGLASGIDATAHQTALEGNYPTIAVVANGLEPAVMFPSHHQTLAANIVNQGGLLLSEYAPMNVARRYQFPARNRLIAALSQAVIVIEARAKSGALITAHYAVEANREVFAIPGSIYSSRSAGTHQLIQSGAQLVTQPHEVVAALTGVPLVTANSQNLLPKPQLNLAQGQIVTALETGPISIHQLLTELPFSADYVASNLTELEIMGIVRRNLDFSYSLNHEMRPSHSL